MFAIVVQHLLIKERQQDKKLANKLEDFTFVGFRVDTYRQYMCMWERGTEGIA